MFVILCVLFIMNIFRSNQVSIISKFDLNDTIAVHRIESSDIFPTIDPDIIDDVNLTTVRSAEHIRSMNFIYNLIFVRFLN